MNFGITENTCLAFQRYIDMLKEKNIVAKNLSEEVLPVNKMLPHALWMAEEAKKKFSKHGWPLDKASRWLGFIQAIVIFNGLTTIEEERNVTRPWFKKEVPST